jgi:hypothetical protein
MSEDTCAHQFTTGRLAQLREVVDALDRRVPRPERVGEYAIAQASAVLRHDALGQIAQLQDGTTGGTTCGAPAALTEPVRRGV